MSANPKHPCTLCGNAGHQASRCKELGVPPEGFYKPSPGMHQGDDDDCDNAIRGRAPSPRDDCDDAIRVGSKRRRIERNLALKPMHTIWLNQLLNGPLVKKIF